MNIALIIGVSRRPDRRFARLPGVSVVFDIPSRQESQGYCAIKRAALAEGSI